MDTKEFDKCKILIENYRNEAKKRLIGQNELIDNLMVAFIASGHVLLEGVPGLAKTLSVKTFAEILNLDFKRIQFTPDLLPADVTGTLIYEQNKGEFVARKGPIFANVILADEINRAPAKVQSAMLEAMEEKQVTIGEESYKLDEPFFVLATQNPIEQEGTYNLPEAELDRFLMKIVVNYPSPKDEAKIIKTQGKALQTPINKVLLKKDIELLENAFDAIVCDDKIVDYIVQIISVTRNTSQSNFTKEHDITNYITIGASPRAGISMIQAAKATALINGRSFVLPDDIKAVSYNVLRHRLVLSYEAVANNITSDNVIEKILNYVPVP